ncbi:uncharacterized protein LOC124916386 [Impatiens glandulifera]|uniref:uncharacterized protein LOC124916386 n=1 Tax=Impatiens glandulifera TaxID=253017 RepID=UPI001FB156FA|nr:uncharacterized protein LOC124916386 [Impatiens glandulifera]
MAPYRIPVMRFKRVAAAFEDHEVVRARICSESSGSEHSPGDYGSMDLSDMVNSFMELEEEKDNCSHEDNSVVDELDQEKREIINDDDDDNDDQKQPIRHRRSEESTEEMKADLRRLMGYNESVDGSVDPFKEKVRSEIERQLKAFDLAYDSPFPSEFKRSLMAALRERGFDAGLCKSKWEKAGKCPPGSYEYVDVKEGGGNRRYIIEVNLGNEFSIVRPTESYNSLIENIPFIFVGKSEHLKRAVRIVCNAMKHSMHQTDMSVPPWRRHAYLQAKWFGSYRRTINSGKTGPAGSSEVVKRRSVGFEPVLDNCRKNSLLVGKGGRRMMIGQLALAFNVSSPN